MGLGGLIGGFDLEDSDPFLGAAFGAVSFREGSHTVDG